MPRTGIIYDQVAAVADSMMAERINPTIRNVTERLGTGSGTTIHKHLTRWRNERQAPAAVTTELPVVVCSAIHAEIERSKAEVRAEFENRLVIYQEEANDLAEFGKSLEDRLEKRTEEFDAVTAERDALSSTLEKQTATIELLNREIERERFGCEQARTETAEVRITVNVQNEKIQALSSANTRLQSENSIILRSHQEFECRIASLTAKLEAAHEKSNDLAEAMTRNKTELERITTLYANETQIRVDAEVRIAICTTQLESERSKYEALVSENEKLLVELTTERENKEFARTNALEIGLLYKIQSDNLKEKIAQVNDLTGLLEAERFARIEAEKTVALCL